MAIAANDMVISEAVWNAEDNQIWIKRAVLVILGVALLWACAKLKLPIPPSPVPVNFGTFGVMVIGAAYGPRLGLVTIITYMVIGALGFDIFANSTSELNGIEYMMGGTGGYLLGFVLATLALGAFARMGWDRNIALMALAMVVGNILIYIPGILWLAELYTWEKPILDWGLYPFLIGDAVKILIAALLLPALWKAVGSARG